MKIVIKNSNLVFSSVKKEDIPAGTNLVTIFKTYGIPTKGYYNSSGDWKENSGGGAWTGYLMDKNIIIQAGSQVLVTYGSNFNSDYTTVGSFVFKDTSTGNLLKSVTPKELSDNIDKTFTFTPTSNCFIYYSDVTSANNPSIVVNTTSYLVG